MDAAIKGFDQTDVKDLFAAFNNNKGAVGRIELAEEADAGASEFHYNKVTHKSVEVCALDISSSNITAFVGINHDGENEGVSGDGGG